jgi:D-alanyl-D-alanine carboxypeptidase
MKAISGWLDQFFIRKISGRGEAVATIPVFYGRSNEVDITLQDDHFLLLSRNCNNNVTKVFRYRTALQAPVAAGFPVGWAFYKTGVFQNWISKTITASAAVKKANRWKTICDSISYVIFGTPSGTYRQTAYKEPE